MKIWLLLENIKVTCCNLKNNFFIKNILALGWNYDKCHPNGNIILNGTDSTISIKDKILISPNGTTLTDTSVDDLTVKSLSIKGTNGKNISFGNMNNSPQTGDWKLDTINIDNKSVLHVFCYENSEWKIVSQFFP